MVGYNDYKINEQRHLKIRTGVDPEIKTYIVMGEQACGKTRNAEKIKELLGCISIIDDWVPNGAIIEGAVHLTSCDFSDIQHMKATADVGVIYYSALNLSH